MRPGDEIGNLGLVDSLKRYGVDLDLEPRRLGCGDAFKHLRQRIAPGEFGKAVPVQRIERNVDPFHARCADRLGKGAQLRGIGGHGQLFQTIPDLAAQGLYQLDHVAPHQRLATGQADLGDAPGNEAQRHIVQFFQAENFCARQEGLALRHAIGTAQVAAIRHRQAQIRNPALELIDEGGLAAHAAEDNTSPAPVSSNCSSCPVTPSALLR